MNSVPITNLQHRIHWIAPTVLFITGLALFRADPPAAIFGNLCFVALVVWLYLRCQKSQDEVVQAANRAAMATGAPLGLGLAFASIFLVRQASPASELVTSLTRDAISPATAGFGLGVLYTCLLVTVTAALTWAGWWASKR